MDYQFLTLTKQDRIVVVQINRPQDRNALCAGLIRELIAVTNEIRRDMSVSVVVLCGQEGFFSAGFDLKDPEIVQILQEPLSVRRRLFQELGPRMCQVWQDLPQVTFVAIEGFCIGGAVSLALSCDFRLMAEKAYLRIPEINLGMNYSWGSLPRLVNLVGPAKTKQWVMFAHKVEADEAFQSGFAQWTVPIGKTLEKARELAEKIARKPQSPILMTKQTVNALTTANQSIGHMDADQFALTVLSEDFQEGLEAFMSKREPVFNKNLPE
ncbi:MAG: enoyl-CoA hydratase [Desulfobacca sp.]|nr:enoyl-CoA hydratase [Desulfobacca sp.]